MFQIVAAIAEFERALIKKRVRAGLQNCEEKEPDCLASLDGQPDILAAASGTS
jgi:resolvase-like protein